MGRDDDDDYETGITISNLEKKVFCKDAKHFEDSLDTMRRPLRLLLLLPDDKKKVEGRGGNDEG